MKKRVLFGCLTFSFCLAVLLLAIPFQHGFCEEPSPGGCADIANCDQVGTEYRRTGEIPGTNPVQYECCRDKCTIDFIGHKKSAPNPF